MLEWIKDPANIASIFLVWAAAIGLAQQIVRLTPGESDDRWVARIGGWAEKARNLLTGMAPGATTKDQSR